MEVTRKVLISPRELLARAKRDAADFNEAVAREAERWAHLFVPKRTGTLDSTIETEVHADGSATVKAGGERAPYALAVEFGYHHASGRFMPAQPYMIPAVETAKRKARGIARRKLRGRR